MLLTAIMVTSLFSVTLSAKTGGKKGERKFQAMVAARQVSSRLRNYVTADLNATKPKGPGTGTNPWSMTSGGITDTVSSACAPFANPNCYALADGIHTLTGVMGAFELPPYNARVKYSVSTAANNLKTVTITTNWDEP